MKPRRFYQSLRFRATVGVVLPLLVILATLSFVQYRNRRASLLEDLALFTDETSAVVRGSLHQAMLSQSPAQMQDVVDQISRQEGVVNLAILDPAGEVRVAPGGKSVGTLLPLDDPTCQACHRLEPPDRQRSIILTLPSGQRVLRGLTTVENSPECHACHDPQSKITGIIITDLSTADFDRHLAADLRNSLLWSLGAILAAAIAVTVVVSRLLVTPLEQLALAMAGLEAGNPAHPMIARGRDEMSEVIRTFNRMAEGMQEKVRLEGRVHELLKNLMVAQEEERKRIARELHDELAQTLAALLMSLEATEGALPGGCEAARGHITRTMAVARRMIEQTRQFMVDLHPVILDEMGLVPALRWYVEKRMESQPVQVLLETSGTARRLPSDVELAVFRIVQEAVNNVAKHAQASTLRIEVAFQPEQVRVTVTDDGRGFSLAETMSSSTSTPRLGLLEMPERAALVHGSVTVDSVPGLGTRVEVEIPLA